MVEETLCSNTIAGGFAGGGNSNSSQRKYAMQMLATNVISLDFTWDAREKIGFNITFYEEDTIRVNPHNNDLMVISMQHGDWDIR